VRQKSESNKKYRPGRLQAREDRVGYLFVAPWMLGAIIFVIYPLFQSFVFALNKIKMTPKGRISTFVGMKNFTNIWAEDPDFVTNLMTYLAETILAIPVIVVFALMIAMLLNGKIKCRGFFRLIFFLPVIIASGPVMNQLTDQGAATIPVMDATMIEQMLEQYLPHFLAEPIGSVFSNFVMLLWYSGVQILLFLAALQKIDASLYEAAKIDGGSGWECFWKITLPTIKPMILLNAIYTVVFMSNNEQNDIINLIYTTMFSVDGGYGYASAMAWMYSIIELFMIGVVTLIIAGRKDEYEKNIKRHKKQMRKQARLQRKLERRRVRHETKRRREQRKAITTK